MNEYPLDVVLNGSRGYVQGTQMLARAAEVIAPGKPVILRQAAFHSITDRLVSLIRADDADSLPEQTLGRAVFEGTDGQLITVVFVEGAATAPRADIPPGCTWTRLDADRDNPLDADFALSGLTTGEDFLNALIQSLKDLHQSLKDDVSDVWFTGLRKAAIPLPDFPEPEGRLEIRAERLMGRDEAFQSIQRITFEGAAGTRLDAAVTFAFKSRTFSHVA